MEYVVFFAAVLGVHFLLFQHKHTAKIRTVLCDLPVLKQLLCCVFCQGFWSGALTYIVVRALSSSSYPPTVEEIPFAFLLTFASSMIVLVFTVLFDPLLLKYEITNK